MPRDEKYLAEQKKGVPTSAWISWGIAGGALVGAAVAGPIALKRDKDLDSGCGSTPEGCTSSERKRVTRPARVADAMLITAGAAAITGTILFFVQRNKKSKERPETKEPDKPQLTFAPWGDRHSAGGTAALQF